MKKKFQKYGSSLILVLCLLAIVSIIGGAAVTTSYSTEMNTINQINTQQAYFTARSAVDTTIKYIQEYGNDSAKINALISNAGIGTEVDMGSYTVNVSHPNGDVNSIKVASTASYKRKTSTVAAYLSKTMSTPAIIPTDYVIYVDGNVNDGDISPNVLNGPVYVNGDFNLSYGSTVQGKLISTGNIIIKGGSATTNGIICFGDVTLNGGGAVNGDVLLKGNLTFGGGTIINGNAQCDGNLSMPQGTIKGNAKVGGNASFSGGAPKINSGKLYYQGLVSYAWGSSISTWVPAGAELANYTSVDLDSYANAVLPQITAPNISNNVTLTNNTISSSGKLLTSAFSSLPYGTVVTIDSSSQDINLLVDNTTFNPELGLHFEVTGPHNVYIYLTGSSSLIVGSNQFIGMKTKSLPSKIFIIGDGTQSVTLQNNCEVDANIYIPMGSFSASGSPLFANGYMIQGTCIVKIINIGSQISMNYVKPDTAGTPLEVISSGQTGSGKWNIVRWAKN